MGEISTKERLVTEAMRLFGEQGYKATSVAQIEKAAGLTPGSGGLYHHFKSRKRCWRQASIGSWTVAGRCVISVRSSVDSATYAMS